MQRAARRANGLQPLAARVRHAAHHTLLQRAALCCSGRHCVANAATGCNNLRSVATDGTALQPAALLVCCSGSHCVALIAATGYNGLWSVATGCGLLQRIALNCNHRCNRLQQAAVCCNRIALCCHHRCNRLQRAVVCCNRPLSVVSGSHCVTIIAATGCNGPWSIATACGLLSADRTVLQSSLQPVATG